MHTVLKTAIALYSLVGLLFILGAANYALRPDYMPYHEAATGVPFEELAPEHQGLYLGLMKSGSGGGVAVGLTLILLSVVGLRRSDSLAFWMLPLIGLTFLAPQHYGTYYIHTTTSGGPPVIVGWTLMAVVCGAAGLSYLGRR